jgi:radical SAM protein with 4Fe4S-binding SPASM domain
VAYLRSDIEIENKFTEWLEHLRECILNPYRERGLRLSSVKISGGEPLLLGDDFIQLINEISDLTERIFVESNATLLDEHYVLELANVRKLLFAVSIDGFEKTHDTIRGVPGAFAKALRGAFALRKRELLSQVITVVQHENLGEVVKLAVYLWELLRVPVRLLLPVRLGRGRALYSSFEDALKLLNACIDTMRQLKRAGIPFSHNVPPALLPRDLWDSMNAQDCGWGRSMVGVLPNLDVALCGGIQERNLVYGSLRYGDIFSVLAGSELARRLASISRTSKKGVCRYCLAWKICRGYCLAESYHVYRELEAPGVLCQEFFNNGFFPDYALEEGAPREELEYP